MLCVGKAMGAAAGPGSALKAEEAGEAEPGARVLWIKGLAQAHLVSPHFSRLSPTERTYTKQLHRLCKEQHGCL